MIKYSHRQAIRTKYIPPTDTRGGRIAAKCTASRIIVDWDHSLDVAHNHMQACKTLINKMGWDQDFVGGELPDGTFAFVVCNAIGETVIS